VTEAAEVGVAVVGGSIAGARTVQQLRRSGYTRPILLVEREPHLPYDRPPLSKAVLESEVEAPPTLISASQATELDVDLLLGRTATDLDLVGRVLHLDDGSSFKYRDGLVIASGAAARESPWSHLPHVHELRCWDDASNLRRGLDDATSIVVIGAGFIGAEVASVARKRGLIVDIVDIQPVPMARHFGPEIGRLFVDLHHNNGVTTHFGHGVSELKSDERGVRVLLSDGTTIAADLAVVGLGTQLNTGWLTSSGLSIDDGVICDQRGHANDNAAVFAIGDVARWWDPVTERFTRYEHWTNAVEQAAVVAHNITHPDDLQAHTPTGYVWSNQYSWKVQVAGKPSSGCRHEVVRGKSERLLVLWADENDRVCGVLTVNWPQLSLRGRQALASHDTLQDARTRLLPDEEPRPTASKTLGGAE
jgi:NADPH-dependent 2,4-dienoyl-CoA reductase/sulfur reductase-like enzyme